MMIGFISFLLVLGTQFILLPIQNSSIQTFDEFAGGHCIDPPVNNTYAVQCYRLTGGRATWAQ
jgi:hypothetical protein